MKKLFLKFGLLLLIVLVISQIALMTMPFSWGNIRLNTKYETYIDTHDQYNTLFVGASTTYRHIDCRQFDSIINAQRPDMQIRSFNFGIPANRTPQSVYMLNNLLEFDKSNIKYIVIDLSELTKMGADNLHKKEMIYWYNYDNILGVMKASYESEKSITKKVSVPGLHAFSFLEKSFMIGMGTAFIQQHAGKNIEPGSLGPNGDGFYSLDQEMADEPEGDLALRYQALRTPDTIQFRTDRCQFLFDKYKDTQNNPNKTIQKDIEQLIAYGKQNNIKIIVMLSQRLGDRLEYLIPLYNKLPEENKIGFQNPTAYPMLNERENLFDLAHLNASGARLFTGIFAEEFIRRVDLQNGVAPQMVNTADTSGVIQNYTGEPSL